MRRLALPALSLLALLALALARSAAAQPYRASVDVQAGGTLTVRLFAGSIEVETDDEPVVAVEARARGFGGGSVDFQLTSDGADARFVAERAAFWGFGTLVDVRVTVPERYSLHLETGGGSIDIEELDGDIYARTSGGSIDVEGATGDVELRTSGGSLRAEEIGGDLRAHTSGGSIRVSEIRGALHVNTSGGAITADEVGGPVEARTSGGPISVRFTQTPQGEVRTSGGGIEAEFPRGVAFELDARTSGGRVRLDDDLRLEGAEVSSSQVRGRVNGGGPGLRLRTSGGNIRVYQR